MQDLVVAQAKGPSRSPAISAPALYRENPGSPWVECTIGIRHWPTGAFILREVGKALPGVWLGYPDQVRLPGPTFDEVA